MPFALFTTLLVTCSFESRQPLVIRYTNTIIFIEKWQETCTLNLLILGREAGRKPTAISSAQGTLSPLKLTWGASVVLGVPPMNISRGVHVSHTNLHITVWGTQ